MGFVRAKSAVFLPQEHGGYRHAGEEFDYNGPDNPHLEAVTKQPYYEYSVPELKAEIARRGLTLPPQGVIGDRKLMNDLLVADDQKPDVAVTAEGNGDDLYGKLSRDELKAKLDERGLTYASNAKAATLRNQLLEHDTAPKPAAGGMDVLGDTPTAEREDHAAEYEASKDEEQQG